MDLPGEVVVEVAITYSGGKLEFVSKCNHGPYRFGVTGSSDVHSPCSWLRIPQS